MQHSEVLVCRNNPLVYRKVRDHNTFPPRTGPHNPLRYLVELSNFAIPILILSAMAAALGVGAVCRHERRRMRRVREPWFGERLRELARTESSGASLVLSF